MASSYPGGLDNFSTSHQDNVDEIIHASTVNDNADAINKIEAELGTDPKGSAVDVKTRIADTETVANAAIPSSYLDTDGTLAADSDTKIATQKAVKTYVDANAGTSETLHTVASSTSSLAINFATADVWDITLTANCTFTLAGATSGVPAGLTLLLRQDGTGSRTVTWPGSVTWLSGAVPVLHAAASSVDVVSLFTLDGGTTWYGAQANPTTLTSSYRKVTSKQVVNTVTESDLLNGEITLAAGVLGTDKMAKIVLWGDWLQNAGSTSGPWFRLKIGSTYLFSWLVGNAMFNCADSATRWTWRYEATIAAANSTSAQVASIAGWCSAFTSSSSGPVISFAGMNDGSLGSGIGLRQSFHNGATQAARETLNGNSTSAEDSTAALAVRFLVVNGVASANYDTTLRGAIVEIV